MVIQSRKTGLVDIADLGVKVNVTQTSESCVRDQKFSMLTAGIDTDNASFLGPEVLLQLKKTAKWDGRN
ncbi:UNVERIFIED_CONTAM: hypothetical protein K2H54_022911 [Gekko kuhli]